MRLFALSLLVSVAFAQSQPGEAPKKARLEGTVVSTTGEPIPRAQIRLQGPASTANGQFTQGTTFTATSGPDGKWAIENVDPGRDYRLTAQRQGFVNSSYGTRGLPGGGASLTVSPGQTLTGLDLIMTPQAVISGRVTDQADDPIQNVMIQVMRRSYTAAGRQLQLAGSAQTNDLGEFRVANLLPGRYYVSATDRFNLRSAATASEANMTTYYPNSADPQGAAALDVAAGTDLRGIDIRMRRGKVFHARGRLVGPDDHPVTGAMLLVNPRDNASAVTSAPRPIVQVRPDGTFEVDGLAPASYTIQTAPNAVVNGVPAPKLAGRLEFTISEADVNDLTLALSPGGKITGSLRLEEGDIKTLLTPANNRPPATAVTSGSYRIGGGLSKVSVILSETLPGGSGGVLGEVAEDGSFQLEGLSSTKYRLSLGGMPLDGFIKSATLNGTDVMKNGMDLASGGGGTLDIVFSKKFSQLTGTVQVEQNQSAAGIVVSIWPADSPLPFPDSLRFARTTNQDGTFQFPVLRPGTYYVAAWQEIEPGLTQVPEFLSQFTAQAQKLTVEEGAAATAQLKPIPAASIQAAEAKLP